MSKPEGKTDEQATLPMSTVPYTLPPGKPVVLRKETGALLEALLPKDGAETTEATDECYRATLALHAIIQAMQERILRVQGLRRAMLEAETNRAGWSWSNRIDTTCNAMEADCKAVALALDRLAEESFDLDRYGRDWAESNERKGITFQGGGTGE